MGIFLLRKFIKQMLKAREVLLCNDLALVIYIDLPAGISATLQPRFEGEFLLESEVSFTFIQAVAAWLGPTAQMSFASIHEICCARSTDEKVMVPQSNGLATAPVKDLTHGSGKPGQFFRWSIVAATGAPCHSGRAGHV